VRALDVSADLVEAVGESILGFQNTSALEDQVGYIPLFKELGVGVMQITYNTQQTKGAETSASPITVSQSAKRRTSSCSTPSSRRWRSPRSFRCFYAF
jgi:microsomal dipeptidase-like Zn-dependent dipeptidase